MAVAAYYAWDRLGRPLEPCRPVRDLVAAVQVAYPRSAAGQGWWADDSHYETNQPEDHTPFSVTDWPVDCPRYVVFATDVMPGPDLDAGGLDTLTAYWVAEAKANRFPSLKYVIRRDRIYTTWRDWRADPYYGAYHSHIHVSFRTDYETNGFGDWDPIPGGDMLTDGQAYALHKLSNRVDALIANAPTITIPAYADRAAFTEPNQLAVLTRLLLKAVVAVEARDKVAAAALASITALITAGGGNLDTAAVLARIDHVAVVLGQQQASVVADLQAEIDRLTAALLAAAKAQADALDGTP